MGFRGQVGLIVPLIMLVVFAVIALQLAPSVANTNSAAFPNATGGGAGANLSGAAASIGTLVPLLYIVVIIVALLGFVAIRR